MIIDTDAAQGEWFTFFTSHIDPQSGEPKYDAPDGDARVKIRSIGPFVEERMMKRKKVFENVLNPKTRSMERLGYYPELSADEQKAERDDMWDYAILDFENFTDAKTGDEIPCNRDNKLKMMRLPVFDRFVARCQQLLSEAGIKAKADAEKN